MNISEMSNDQATDAIVRISAALNFICEDKEVVELFQNLSDDKGKDMTLIESITKYLPRVTALALRKHKDSMYEIVGALAQKDSKEVGKMSFTETLGLLRENWETVKDFFSSTEDLSQEAENK